MDVEMAEPDSPGTGNEGSNEPYTSPSFANSDAPPYSTLATAPPDSPDDLRDIFTSDESDGDQEDVYDPDLEAMRSKRIPAAARPEQIPEELEDLLAEAQTVWLQGDHDDAIKLCEEAVKINGNVRSFYNLLVSIYEDKGDMQSALKAKFLAATLNKSSIDDWMEIVERAIEQGYHDDAALALQHVSNIKGGNWEIRWKRARIHVDLGQHSKALAVLNRLRSRHLQDMEQEDRIQLFKCTSVCLRKLGRTQDALELYKKIFEENQKGLADPECDLEYEGLDEYASILFSVGMYAQCIYTIKTGLRTFFERTGWEDAVDDAEYDPKRNPEAEGNDVYYVPTSMRTTLLECRLKLWLETHNSLHLEEATHHLPLLLGEMDADMCWRAGDAFFAAREYGTARLIYDDLSDKARSVSEHVKSWVQIAKCCFLLKNIESAIKLYLEALKKEPENIEALIGLAESYQETGQKKRSRELVQKACELRDKQLDISEQPAVEIDETTDPALIAAESRNAGRMQTKAMQRARHEENQAQLAESAFTELDRFAEGLKSGNEVAAAEWTRNAAILIQIFRSNKKFFPSDRNKAFMMPSIDLNIDERLAMSRVGAADDDEAEEDSFRFKNKTFDEWFLLFMQAALTRARYDQVEAAYVVVRTGRLSNIFHNDPRRDQVMNLVMLSCAYQAKDWTVVAETVRTLYGQDQFNDEILLYYNALLCSGQGAIDTFCIANNQKFFLRNIKALDGAVQNESIKGAARVTKEGIKDSPVLRLLYAQIMLLGPSYTPALTYLLSILDQLPDDPMVLLMCAVVCVQRSLQRVTPNRHLQILQGLSFMQDYFKVRTKGTQGQRQEAEYNMGRFYHGLGLFSLAIPFYERVFGYDVEERYDLSAEAAYNLHLIYAFSGNMPLAAEMLRTIEI